MSVKTKRLFISIAMITLAIGAFTFVYFLKPGYLGFYPPCPFNYLTGYYCPGCGSMRALHELLHGRFLNALDLNPLMIVSLPFLMYVYFKEYWPWGSPDEKSRQLHPWTAKIVLIVILVYWVIRNLPWYPFTLLAP